MNAPFSRARPGFTLIEILIVIAIIGLLSSIVLASLNNARGRGADASIKSNLANARAQAELFYDANGERYFGGSDVTNVCHASALIGGIKGVNDHYAAAASIAGVTPYVGNLASGPSRPAVCHANAGAWAALVQLKSNTSQAFCVDSRGYAAQVAVTALASGDVTCN